MKLKLLETENREVVDENNRLKMKNAFYQANMKHDEKQTKETKEKADPPLEELPEIEK